MTSEELDNGYDIASELQAITSRIENDCRDIRSFLTIFYDPETSDYAKKVCIDYLKTMHQNFQNFSKEG